MHMWLLMLALNASDSGVKDAQTFMVLGSETRCEELRQEFQPLMRGDLYLYCLPA